MDVKEILKLGKAIILNRWMVLVASFLVMISAGGVYIFGIYSQSLKLSLGYDQQTLNTLSFFKDIGTNVGIVGGILYDWRGPPLVFLSGAGLNFVGYIMIWLAVAHKIARPQVWHMCLYFVLSSTCTSFVNTACLVTCIKNFPLSRGIVVGLLKGSLGLGGAILALLFRAIYGNNTQYLILLLAWFPTTVCILLMFIIRIVNAKQLKTDTKNFRLFLGMILTMAAYLMVTIIIQDVTKVSRTVNQIFCVIMLLMLLVPLSVVLKDELNMRKAAGAAAPCSQACGIHLVRSDNSSEAKDLEESSQSHQVPTHTDSSIRIPSAADKGKNHRGVSEKNSFKEFKIGTHITRKPSSALKFEDLKIQFAKFIKASQRGTDLTPAQALFNLNLWLLFMSSTCGIGSQLMVIDNLGQIGAALRYSQTEITTCVSLVSIWNCLGRVGSGFVSEYFIERKAVPRPWLLAVSLVISSVGHLILALDLPAALYVSSIIIGVCYGVQFTLVFTTISEICGLRFYASILNVVLLSSPLGLYLLSVRTAGLLYDREAKKQLKLAPLVMSPPPSSAAHGTLICNGTQCYKTSFFIMTGTSLLGALFACTLAIRTRWLYKAIQLQHLDHQNEPLQPIRLPAESDQEVSQEDLKKDLRNVPLAAT